MKMKLLRRQFVQLPAITAASAGAAGTESAAPIEVGSRKQLFIDRKFIQHSRGVSLTVNPARKLGPVLKRERPWEQAHIGAYLSVLEHEGIFKMWYRGGSGKSASHLCYATSTDGLHWERPALNLIDFQGSTANNIALFRFRSGGVLLDPVAPPEHRFKALDTPDESGTTLEGYGRRILVLLTSPDGLRWSQPRPVLPFHPDSQNNLLWDPRLQKYVAYLRGWNPLRSVVRCEIPPQDIQGPWPYTRIEKPKYLWSIFEWGKSWPPAISTELPTVLAADEQDPPGCDIYTPNVLVYPHAEGVYLAFPSLFRHTAPPGLEPVPMAGVLDVHLAVSRDGIRWERLDRRPYLGLGVAGETDSHGLYMGLGMLRRGNELYHYYGGVNRGHADPKPGDSAVMLAVQRLDGFISADAGPDGGELITPPLTFQGSGLQLNIDTSATGLARVELQTAYGLPVPGLELRNCEPIIGNQVDRQARWSSGEGLSGLQGKPVRLRFALRNAKLYAFQFA